MIREVRSTDKMKGKIHRSVRKFAVKHLPQRSGMVSRRLDSPHGRLDYLNYIQQNPCRIEGMGYVKPRDSRSIVTYSNNKAPSSFRLRDIRPL